MRTGCSCVRTHQITEVAQGRYVTWRSRQMRKNI